MFISPLLSSTERTPAIFLSSASDAHTTKYIGAGYQEAEELLRQTGFSAYTIYQIRTFALSWVLRVFLLAIMNCSIPVSSAQLTNIEQFTYSFQFLSLQMCIRDQNYDCQRYRLAIYL